MACSSFLQYAFNATDENNVPLKVFFNDKNLMSNNFPKLIQELRSCIHKLDDLCDEEKKKAYLDLCYEYANDAEKKVEFNVGYAKLVTDYGNELTSYRSGATDNLILDFLKSSLLFLNTIEQDTTILEKDKFHFKEAGIALAFNECFVEKGFFSVGGKSMRSKSPARKSPARKSMRSKSTARKSMRSKSTARKSMRSKSMRSKSMRSKSMRSKSMRSKSMRSKSMRSKYTARKNKNKRTRKRV